MTSSDGISPALTPDATSQTSGWSLPFAVASSEPSSLNASEFTSCAWPWKTRLVLVATSHTSTSPFATPTANIVPAGWNANPVVSTSNRCDNTGLPVVRSQTTTSPGLPASVGMVALEARNLSSALNSACRA